MLTEHSKGQLESNHRKKNETKNTKNKQKTEDDIQMMIVVIVMVVVIVAAVVSIPWTQIKVICNQRFENTGRFSQLYTEVVDKGTQSHLQVGARCVGPDQNFLKLSKQVLYHP